MRRYFTSVRPKPKFDVDVSKDSPCNNSLSTSKLAEAKKVAFRRGVWFKALNRIERGIVDLTMRYIDNIRSTKLVQVLTAILEKLQQATESTVERLVRTVGVSLAQQISNIAICWGNRSAALWAQDLCFARYLALCIRRT